jgi:hypothetical protein
MAISSHSVTMAADRLRRAMANVVQTVPAMATVALTVRHVTVIGVPRGHLAANVRPMVRVVIVGLMDRVLTIIVLVPVRVPKAARASMVPVPRVARVRKVACLPRPSCS